MSVAEVIDGTPRDAQRAARVQWLRMQSQRPEHRAAQRIIDTYPWPHLATAIVRQACVESRISGQKIAAGERVVVGIGGTLWEITTRAGSKLLTPLDELSGPCPNCEDGSGMVWVENHYNHGGTAATCGPTTRDAVGYYDCARCDGTGSIDEEINLVEEWSDALYESEEPLVTATQAVAKHFAEFPAWFRAEVDAAGKREVA